MICRSNKYGNKKTVVDGITFDSKAEARRYKELKLLERAGEIQGLKLQPVYVLQDKFCCKGKTYAAIKYIADFEYTENGKVIVEDVKGKRTEVFNIKQKLFLKKYGEYLELRITK